MKRLFLLLICITCLNTHAQKNLFGVLGGINLTNISAKGIFTHRLPRTGIVAGISYDHLFKTKFSLGAKLLFQERGFHVNYHFTDDLGNPIDHIFTAKYHYNYLSIPLSIGYHGRQKFFSIAHIGLNPAILLSANTITPNYSSIGSSIGETTYSVRKRVSPLDLSGIIEIGAGYRFMELYHLYVSASYQHSITDFSNKNYFSSFNLKHYGWSLNLGLKYNLLSGVKYTTVLPKTCF